MKVVTEKIVGQLVNWNIITEDDTAIYKYGVDQLLFTGLNILTTIAIGLITELLLPLSVFTIGYMVLRIYAGGYHAGSRMWCYIFSTGITLLAVLAGSVVEYSILFNFIVGGFSLIVLTIIAPVGTESKPLDEVETSTYRRRMYIVLAVEGVIVTALSIMDSVLYARYLLLAIMFVTIMAVVEKLSKKSSDKSEASCH